MGSFNFDSSDWEEFSIQTFGWAELCDFEEDASAFETRDTFESDYYLQHMIIKAIGKPPTGSKYKLERIESDYTEYGSSVYERLLYIYSPKRKLHLEYLRELTKVLNSKRWIKTCQKEFEKEYQKFIDFKRKRPEDDYEFIG